MFFNKKGIVWRAVLVLFLLCTASPLMLHNDNWLVILLVLNMIALALWELGAYLVKICHPDYTDRY